ncbi:Uma2 family endonuclease [Spirosoma fluviale]|uniref:Endonuclease, Uma2 family (Restriction endonuclease fold) n=1 Tax=Spirosoma fluviale TaxID=1597977 RepID=A0A286GIJ2_9BACT|nr:Uma2 family endonuclease [Spirosoma fluviale]SOD95292.1 Endonuclease, Uma2 family (restriction endonuclease fold) [Spirosoma fluviale]
MEALEKIQLSEERIKSLESGKLIAIPATWEEFEDFLVETDYRVEYHNGKIIIMGLATLIHEILVTRLAYFLTGYYLGKLFYVAGSNAGIRKDGRKGHYNGDILVIKGKPDYQGKSKSIITNPYLIVEVLSPSTLDHDLGAKRRKYEQMDTVQEIVFVDPVDKEVIVCRRTEQANVWTETLYNVPTEPVNIDGLKVPLAEIFADLPA